MIFFFWMILGNEKVVGVVLNNLVENDVDFVIDCDVLVYVLGYLCCGELE